MKAMTNYRNIFIAVSAMLMLSRSAEAQVGQPYIHDPSTIMECDGKYYTFGTGGGGLISDDGWTWKSGAVRPGGGAAPDAIKIGDRYLVAYGNSGGGLGGGHNAHIFTMWNKSLDPQSADFKFSEPVEVASSDGFEDNDAIDPPDGCDCHIYWVMGRGCSTASVISFTAASNWDTAASYRWTSMTFRVWAFWAIWFRLLPIR